MTFRKRVYRVRSSRLFAAEALDQIPYVMAHKTEVLNLNYELKPGIQFSQLLHWVTSNALYFSEKLVR